MIATKGEEIIMQHTSRTGFSPARSSMALASSLMLLATTFVACAEAQNPHDATRETVEQWMTELSNWGRWGDDDQLGTLNLITPEKRRQAVALVVDGVSISLAHDTLKESSADNPLPFEHEMLSTGIDNPAPFASDRLSVAYHGYAHTHMDALCHMFYGGKMYNGFPQEEINQEGCAKLAILNFKQGIVTRGILMDIPRLKGVDYLDPATAIYAEDLAAWEEKAGVRVSSGDVVFIRTGRWARRDAVGPWNVGEGSAGLHASAVAWLHERDAAILGSDAASDLLPSGIEGLTHPVHLLTLIARGSPIFDNCDLEELSQEAAKRGRWEFLLTASPMAIPGGTGSPLNPIATF